MRGIAWKVEAEEGGNARGIGYYNRAEARTRGGDERASSPGRNERRDPNPPLLNGPIAARQGGTTSGAARHHPVSVQFYHPPSYMVNTRSV